MKVEWTGPGAKDLARLDRRLQDRIVAAIDRFATTGQGDVKKLKGHAAEFRLRIGDWRVRFALDGSRRTLTVLSVLPRGGAYRD